MKNIYSSSKSKKKSDESKKKTATRIAIAILAALLLFLLVFLGFKGCSDNPTNPADRGLVYDSEAVSGGWDEADIEKIKEAPVKVLQGSPKTPALLFLNALIPG